MGAITGALFILAVGAIIYYVRKRKKRSSAGEARNIEEKPRGQTPRYELEEQMGRQEMNGRTAPAELNSQWQPVELE